MIPAKLVVVAVGIGVALFTTVVAAIVIAEQLEDDPPETVEAPAGDLPIPFQDDDDAIATPGSGETAENEPSEGSGEAAEGTPSSDASSESCEIEIEPEQAVPMFAFGEVSGLGSGASYIVFESCAGPAAYEGITLLNLADLHATPRPGTPTGTPPPVQDPQIVEDGGCFFLSSLWPDLYFLLTGQTSFLALREIPDVFQARFRASQTEVLSIADDGVNGIVTGGYAEGGSDGGRGSVPEWPIYGRERLQYETSVFGAFEPNEYGIKPIIVQTGEGEAALALGALTAVWSGESTENFSGEEVFGRVSVTCVVAFLLEG